MMKLNLAFLYFFAVVFLSSTSCVGGQITSETPPQSKNYFQGSRGCFLLYNLKTRKFDKIIGEETCRERFVACSTFKVPLSVMAFDSGVLQDENQILKWDGTQGYLQSHDQDHTARTWIRDSVVWFSQRLTPQIGKRKIESYLHTFHYGNEDFSGGITQAWLVSPADPGPSLKISAYEQIEFMKRLWTNQLSVNLRATQITRELLFIETSPQGFRLSGKTGSNFYDRKYDQSMRQGLSWFISHLEKEDRQYLAVTVTSDLFPTEVKRGKAKLITQDILRAEGLW